MPNLDAAREVLRDRYRFERELGRGGMAVVHLAQDLRHERPVAIKILRSDLGAILGKDRFLSEIRLTANLNHPNILPLFDSGEAGGALYYVMPYVAGESLRDRLEAQGRLSLQEATAILRAVASGLDYAHVHGVVHRDIKPENILLQDEATFLADFGVALALSDSRTTSPGLSLGTPAYMSPEQIAGERLVDGRSDVYTLGCVAYEMLAGVPPFVGDARAVMMRHLMEVPAPLSTHVEETSADVEQAVVKAMAKSPDERFPRATDFVRELARSPQGGKGAGEAPPSVAPVRLQQEIRFCTAADGTRLAYAVSGEGPPLLKAANWLSHLEFDAESPLWGHWWSALAERFSLIRYDDRGCGLSDWEVPEITFASFVDDLAAVADAAGHERFVLLGISKGGPIAVAYAARYPERVSHLILHGAFVAGKSRRSNPEVDREAALEIEMVRFGWGKPNPAFREAFTTMFFPDATANQKAWFNELQRISASPENAARLLQATRQIDVRDAARHVQCPTLILHSQDEARVPFEQGRRLAALIPGARFVPLPSRNHLPLAHEPAWPALLRELDTFLTQAQ